MLRAQVLNAYVDTLSRGQRPAPAQVEFFVKEGRCAPDSRPCRELRCASQIACEAGCAQHAGLAGADSRSKEEGVSRAGAGRRKGTDGQSQGNPCAAAPPPACSVLTPIRAELPAYGSLGPLFLAFGLITAEELQAGAGNYATGALRVAGDGAGRAGWQGGGAAAML